LAKLIGALLVFVVAGLIAGRVMSAKHGAATAAKAQKSFYQYSAATDNIEPAGASPVVDARLLEHGRWVYRGLCIGCHGAKGDGNGGVWTLGEKYAKAHKLPRQPRDFTSAVFKVRSTPSGSLPTDRDLFRAISRGLVADQDMPSFKYLPERDRWAVLAYIKSLSKRWVEEKDYQEPAVEVGEPPLPEASSVEAGKQVYADMKCAKCHGELGKGDGPSAPELTDDNGLKIKPRDFSDATQFVAANDARGIYQTFTTGLDGTPMPTFADFLNEEKRWQLVYYVMSLRPGWTVANARREMQAAAAAQVTGAAGQPTGGTRQ
jgi:mono/diheme cytochrome c family protein